MIERRKGEDRRCEPRSEAVGQIAWLQMEQSEPTVGWLSDRSRSSVSFIASSGERPEPGEYIELIGVSPSRQRACVTRVAAYDDRHSLIACRCRAEDSPSPVE